MTVQDLMSFFKAKNLSALSQKIGVCKATITNWNKSDIPMGEQALIELGTKGKLKADVNKVKYYDQT